METEESTQQANAEQSDELQVDQTQEAVTDADNSESSTEESSNSDTDGDTTAKPKSKGVQKRIDELVRQRSDVERDRDYWRELAMKSQEPEAMEPQAPEIPPMPRDVDFDTVEDYQAAVSERDQTIIDLAVGRVQSQQQETQQQTTEQERALKFNQAVEKLSETHPDAKSLIYGRDSAAISPEMAETLLNLDNSAQVAYELASKPEVAYRISQLDSSLQKIEIGKLSATVSLPQPKTISQAPAPVKTLGTNGEPAKPDPSKMDIETWMKKRNAGEI